MLLKREDLRDRIIRLTSRQKLNFTTQIVEEGTRRISHYLLAQSIVNGSYGLSVAIGLWTIGRIFGSHEGGFPNVLLWGLLSAIFRFIPYVGVWIAAAFPIILSFGIFSSNSVVLATLLLFICLELIISQFIEPLLYGSVTGMSTMAVLVSAVFWTSIWGPIGLILSTPMTVVLAILGKYVPQLQFLNILLGDEPVLDPPERIYQRLLAFDQEEAQDLAAEYLETVTLGNLFDDVLIPALIMAEQDHHQGKLDDHRWNFIQEGLKDIIEELTEPSQDELSEKSAAPASTTVAPASSSEHLVLPSGSSITVLCLPCRKEADEIPCLMLSKLLRARGYHVVHAPTETLIGEKSTLIDQHHPHIVCISAVPPGAVTQARSLCKWLLDKHPDINIIVGLWKLKTDATKVQARLPVVNLDQIVTTLKQAQTQIDRLAHTFLYQPKA
jgi:hypothetical protein